MYLDDDDAKLPREYKSIPAQYYYHNWVRLDGTLESLAICTTRFVFELLAGFYLIPL
jgi:hypothetical protein